MGEPDPLNPSSFANISIILRNIGKRARIKKYVATGTREWLFLEVDGGIFVILIKLIKNVLQCHKCLESFYGIETFENHSCYILHTASFEREFDWIVPLPGLLYLEMNAAKSFMSLNWSIFMEEVAKHLGFTTDVALKCIKKGGDHHKLWQILEIVYLAFSDELLLPCERDCFQKRTTPDLHGYWEYSQNVTNGTYLYCQQMIFTYLHSLMLLRKSVRNNSSTGILSAQSKIMHLFFGRNHPAYREILFEFFKVECCIPYPVQEFMHSNLLVSRSGNQGGDAVLEEINKAGKKWSIGVSSYPQWRLSFRNLDDLTKVILYLLLSLFCKLIKIFKKVISNLFQNIFRYEMLLFEMRQLMTKSRAIQKRACLPPKKLFRSEV